ncbi:bifunctional hydroxymethylpyrimidine kinase/phosphomethylpyrimidine kinase [Corynebacterium sp. 153RC1]|uniref:bifunctional hydroxymethylpyrimidine kinase/phosphomethylpyrimidine kinase n=1 Tax=unclassified Corynebacterium TaxID=2624378 RepID=UPI00211BAFB4|nr:MULTISPECIES: bifunctional hydroxymethylpyrimidine kinase/phosphomethylpyrimidine kinase [unclassified Corynebacterium]MCQ9352795.1 bifunctional hydroxymethylpyrimidine kinase/phosphomethylpyrimidine kinase [Corynebacterium sp. 209RC1]MCQ9354979.1 bifunctional hydroxymethylpyrimidine kinase/phosphomethylpyrimidine kinase [Corynebacterium sp. 1222RC1]MCQ9357240.1 bifunctional hydroxymethylpyrimidine kinase/phosphomethylpyrimidine kinase [Corynebacterium sp. 122RC1]MCQ9359415.1 bifunctional hy
MIPNVLSIAGTDPTGGAGIHADLKSIAAAGGHGMAVVTSLVAQNTLGVRSIHTPPPEFLYEQLLAVSDDVRIDALKVGMLGSPGIIAVVKRWLEEVKPEHVVIDPVMVTTSGHRLLSPEAENSLREVLPAATMITPNVPELAVLANVSRETIKNLEQAIQIAQHLAEQFDVQVVVEAGHLSGPEAGNALVNKQGVLATAPSQRVETNNTHGTGCSLSSALATRLGMGETPAEALRWATDWLHGAIVHAEALSVGQGNGPVHHFWRQEVQ